jgi:hypothetical protein
MRRVVIRIIGLALFAFSGCGTAQSTSQDRPPAIPEVLDSLSAARGHTNESAVLAVSKGLDDGRVISNSEITDSEIELFLERVRARHFRDAIRICDVARYAGTTLDRCSMARHLVDKVSRFAKAKESGYEWSSADAFFLEQNLGLLSDICLLHDRADANAPAVLIMVEVRSATAVGEQRDKIAVGHVTSDVLQRLGNEAVIAEDGVLVSPVQLPVISEWLYEHLCDAKD